MDLSVASVTALLRETFTRPRSAAELLLRMNIPDDARWLGFVIVVLLSVILGYGSVSIMQGENGLAGSLVGMAVMQSTLILGMVVAVQGIGRALGGKGTFPDTLLLIAWMQFAMLVFQLAQLATLLIVPALFGLVTLLSLVVFFWVLVNFIAALHGFTSLLKVMVGIIFSLFGLSLVLAILLSLFGFGAVG